MKWSNIIIIYGISCFIVFLKLFMNYIFFRSYKLSPISSWFCCTCTFKDQSYRILFVTVAVYALVFVLTYVLAHECKLRCETLLNVCMIWKEYNINTPLLLLSWTEYFQECSEVTEMRMVLVFNSWTLSKGGNYNSKLGTFLPCERPRVKIPLEAFFLLFTFLFNFPKCNHVLKHKIHIILIKISKIIKIKGVFAIRLVIQFNSIELNCYQISVFWIFQFENF